MSCFEARLLQVERRCQALALQKRLGHDLVERLGEVDAVPVDKLGGIREPRGVPEVDLGSVGEGAVVAARDDRVVVVGLADPATRSQDRVVPKPERPRVAHNLVVHGVVVADVDLRATGARAEVLDRIVEAFVEREGGRVEVGEAFVLVPGRVGRAHHREHGGGTPLRGLVEDEEVASTGGV